MAVILFRQSFPKEKNHFVVEQVIHSELGNTYSLEKRIAAGGNGVVHKCIEQPQGAEYAIKFQLDIRKKRLERFSRELQLMQQIQHEHLIRYYDHGIAIGKQKRGKSEKEVEVPFVIMELAQKNLFDILREIETKEFEIYVSQFRGLARGLGELHKVAIHRDLKPQNILISGDHLLIPLVRSVCSSIRS